MRLTRLQIAKLVVVATGVWWGLCMQLIYYAGAGHSLSLLPNIDWYMGMMLVYVHRPFSAPDTSYARVRQRHILPIAVSDVIGTIGTTVGLVLAGSAIFGIILGSITVWTALLTWLLMGHAQTRMRLAGILTVVLGLAFPALETDVDTEDGKRLAAGIVLTFLGTFFYALEYALCERVYTLYSKPLDAKELCFYTGAWGLALTSVWFFGYTVPNWETLVRAEMASANGDALYVCALYASHMLNNALHNVAWFVVCELEGGVSTGLLQGVKAALLFIASAIMFCSPQHEEQCMSASKVIATCMVLAGTTIYYLTCPEECAVFPGSSYAKAFESMTPSRLPTIEADDATEQPISLCAARSPSKSDVLANSDVEANAVQSNDESTAHAEKPNGNGATRGAQLSRA